MKIGIIGAGPIGTTLSNKLSENGHEVKIADVRSIERLKNKTFSGKAVDVEDVIVDIDMLILSIPTFVIPSIDRIISQVAKEVIIVDTSNYYPFRDDKIEAIEKGEVESIWVSQQIGRDVVKAFNNLLAYTLANKGTHQDDKNRIAIAVSGNNIVEKEKVMHIVNEVGFDVVDNGDLNNSWRAQPGTPAYCTELTKEELKEALEKANKEKAPSLREKVIASFSPDFNHEDIVNLNRKIYNEK
ncbi:NAD(P)-binding domain-containing protein [Listeria sp. FSL L7-1485]|uniref:NAD(P)-binding domain-containing protein n=1 Tax=Listeria immobilis TaxID=2713502 RepID=A0A7X1C964_9LIST|nr:NAD(P)-binding domain-containing protein [Listeria immobilis]MBC1488971.1 NAD(P)-binding domain-containing protein [Listeria immobilis]MBC1516024.1 NAD(P)-binding domain-containing protein [Listeria immobilis]MBC1536268.1 NAD(P)-binding domain-containing protein [Listeria immobilis]